LEVAVKGIGYIRVSRVGHRQGDSFLSPTLQRESIERVCQREGVELVDVYEELDKSGGDAARPLWNKAIERIESGEVQAFVCWNLSRFARSILDAKRAIERIERAGGTLLSEEGAEGLSRDILLVVADHERQRHADAFRRAEVSAVERGIHIASRVPTGYTRDPATRRLVPDEMAPVVAEVFRLRAKGWGWTKLARWFVEQGGSPKSNSSAMTWMVRNRAYLGWAHQHGAVNRKAHPAIVTQLEFDRANAIKGRRPEHDGSLSSQLLMLGLVFCETCGWHLSVGSSTRVLDNVKTKVATYTCQNPNCTGRAAAHGRDLDPLVVGALFRMLRLVGTTGYRAPGTTPADVEAARRALEAAEYDRKRLVGNRELRRLLTDEEYNAELVDAAEAVEEARVVLDVAESGLAGKAPEDVTALWEEWTDETRREWLREVVERVEVVPARGKRGIPLGERIRMEFRGIDGDQLLEATDADLEDRRRRLRKMGVS
jgi:DNA invertase Pin-like site-specific DNA recombinase